MTATPVLEATGLRKSFGPTRAVDGIDLTMQAGQTVAVLGPNGAGKTTLVEMLLGIRRPDAGSVRLLGRPPGARAVAARVGAMLQECRTPQALTVAETITLVRRYYPRAHSVPDILDRAGLTARARTRASQLSGGERQRLSFALAIVGAPEVVFLDEPTAAMDVAARRAFWRQIRGLAHDGTAILLTTHNMAEVEALADRVVVVDHGRVVADGTPAQVAALVATRRIEVSTDAGVDALDALPGVVSAVPTPSEMSPEGDDLPRYILSTTNAEATVRGLVAHRIHRLVVHDSDMETAFLHLVGDGRRAGVQLVPGSAAVVGA